MKKYTIKDSLGNKKTIYAENLSHALTFVDSKFYVGISKYDYTKEQAEKDARKYGLQLKIVGKSHDPNVEYDAYLVGPRSNILKMLKSNDMEDFEEDIEDSKAIDAKFKESNDVYYKFERGYWHVLSIHNGTEMDHQDVMSLARKNNVMIEPYFKYDYHRTDKGGYYTDYKVKGKDKNGVIKFCETMNPIVKPLTFSNDAEDSKIVDAVQSAETYANTGWIENKLASDLISEGQKNNYDFNAVLKKFDSLSKQILAVVKNALDNARKEIVDYKSRY